MSDDAQPVFEEYTVEQHWLGTRPYILIEQLDNGELKFQAARWPSKRQIRKVLRMFSRRTR